MRSDGATNFGVLLEASFRLKLLQREMIRLAPRDENYESNQRALRTAIRELQHVIVEAETAKASGSQTSAA